MLNLAECKQIRGRGLAALGGLAELERLNLSGCRSLTDKAIVPLGKLAGLLVCRWATAPC